MGSQQEDSVESLSFLNPTAPKSAHPHRVQESHFSIDTCNMTEVECAPSRQPTLDATLPSSPQMGHPRNPGTGYRVLVFDGGGYRGYASLLMLKRILQGIVPKSKGPVYPYKYFDLICGTSTGGLIAILLAVLHLDIDRAITLYRELARTLFTSTWRWLRWLLRDERFSSGALKEEIMAVIKQHGFEGKKMYDPEDPDRGKGCRCFVTTATKPRGQSPIRLLRSYEDPSPNVWPHPWTILDAALATSAAPTYFRCHVVNYQNATYHYEDAGIHGLNNPTIAAWDECDRLSPDVTPYCIISLGTGLKRHDPVENNTPASHWILDTLQNLARFPSRLKTLSKHLSNEATKVVDKHEEMERLTRKLNPNPYFRFNPDIDAMGNISLSDHEATARMDNAVYGYINDNQIKFELCVERLKAYPKPLSDPASTLSIAPCDPPSNPPSNLPPSPQPILMKDPFDDPPESHMMEGSNALGLNPQTVGDSES